MEERVNSLGHRHIVGDTVAPRSVIIVPLKTGKTGENILTTISLQSIAREYAFSASDIRLVETLASSMSVALENAAPLRRDPAAAQRDRTAQRRTGNHQQCAGSTGIQVGNSSYLRSGGRQDSRHFQCTTCSGFIYSSKLGIRGISSTHTAKTDVSMLPQRPESRSSTTGSKHASHWSGTLSNRCARSPPKCGMSSLPRERNCRDRNPLLELGCLPATIRGVSLCKTSTAKMLTTTLMCACANARQRHERRARKRQPLRRDPASAQSDRRSRHELSAISTVSQALVAERSDWIT